VSDQNRNLASPHVGEHPRHTRVAPQRFGEGLSFFLAATLAVTRYVLGGPPERGGSGVLAAAALSAVVAVPGLLSLLARNGPRGLLLVASALALVAVQLTWSVTLPMIVSAALFLVAYLERRPSSQRSAYGTLIDAIAAIVAAIVAGLGVAALFMQQDPVEYATATERGSVGDIITVSEAGLSLVASGAIIAVALSVRLFYQKGRKPGQRGSPREAKL